MLVSSRALPLNLNHSQVSTPSLESDSLFYFGSCCNLVKYPDSKKTKYFLPTKSNVQNIQVAGFLFLSSNHRFQQVLL